MHVWEFSEGKGLGDLVFGMTVKHLLENISPFFCSLELASFVLSEFGERARLSQFGEEESYFYLVDFDIRVGFDEYGLLEYICSQESFILNGVELIGLSSEYIFDTWPSSEIDTLDAGVCVLYDCPVDISIDVMNGCIRNITVTSSSKFPAEK